MNEMQNRIALAISGCEAPFPDSDAIRAALRVLREMRMPTPVMLDAADNPAALAVWQRMIDATISDQYGLGA